MGDAVVVEMPGGEGEVDRNEDREEKDEGSNGASGVE